MTSIVLLIARQIPIRGSCFNFTLLLPPLEIPRVLRTRTRERDVYIGSRRGWFVPPFSTGYRTPEFRSHAPGYPGQEPATGGTFVMVISRRYPSAPLLPRVTEVTSRTTPRRPSLTLPRPYISRCAERPGVHGPCAWRSSSRPSCHPIREGGIFPLTHDSPTRRERSSAEELARAYVDDALPTRACSYAYNALVVLLIIFGYFTQKSQINHALNALQFNIYILYALLYIFIHFCFFWFDNYFISLIFNYLFLLNYFNYFPILYLRKQDIYLSSL